MEENKDNLMVYSNQIKNIMETINYILSLWNDIKENDLKELEKNWKSIDSDYFIEKFLENEVAFNKLKELLEDYEILYEKTYKL